MAKDKRDWNAGLNSKGLETSVTEEQAREMCLNQGRRYMFIIEAHSGPKVVNEDGSEKVHLIPDLVELIPSEQEDRIRTFQRALYMSRPDQFGQQAFENLSGQEPNVEQAGGALDAAVETDAEGSVTGLWDGNPDSPVDATGDGVCPFPECALIDGHTGDHDALTGDDPAPEVEEPFDGATVATPNVVQFTHSGKA